MVKTLTERECEIISDILTDMPKVKDSDQFYFTRAEVDGIIKKVEGGNYESNKVRFREV